MLVCAYQFMGSGLKIVVWVICPPKGYHAGAINKYKVNGPRLTEKPINWAFYCSQLDLLLRKQPTWTIEMDFLNPPDESVFYPPK